MPGVRARPGGEGAGGWHYAAAARHARIHQARDRGRPAGGGHRKCRELFLQPLRPAHLQGAPWQVCRLSDTGSRHPPRAAASDPVRGRKEAAWCRPRHNGPRLHGGRAGRDRRHGDIRADVDRQDGGQRSRELRDRLRRHQLGGAQTAVSGRQGGVCRHQYLARRDAAQAHPDRPHLYAGRLDPDRQADHLSDRRQHRRGRQPAHQLDGRDPAEHAPA